MTVPIGTILPYGGDLSSGSAVQRLEREGWLLCDGAAYFRADYSELADVIGTAFGSPSSSQFNVPDLLGRFVRGVDNGTGRDPDAKFRAHSAPGGYEGDKVGSVQDDAMQVHSHNDSGHKHPSYHMASQHQDGRSDGKEYSGWDGWKNHEDNEVGHAQLGGPTKLEGHSDPRSGEETRPKNIYVNWIIKAKNVNG